MLYFKAEDTNSEGVRVWAEPSEAPVVSAPGRWIPDSLSIGSRTLTQGGLITNKDQQVISSLMRLGVDPFDKYFASKLLI